MLLVWICVSFPKLFEWRQQGLACLNFQETIATCWKVRMSDFEILDGVGGWALDRLIRMCKKSFISFFLPVITKGFKGGYFFCEASPVS